MQFVAPVRYTHQRTVYEALVRMKQYDDPTNERSVYKLLTLYMSLVPNDNEIKFYRTPNVLDAQGFGGFGSQGVHHSYIKM